MSNPRTLVVTVGTSLFYSASWHYEGDLKTVENYHCWIEDYRQHPAKRREDTKTFRNLGKLLEKGTGITEEQFAQDFDYPLRYSGELTTLLRYSQKSGESNLAAFLQRNYQEIQLLAATSASNPSHIAARHLQVILRDKLDHPNVTMPEILTSKYLSDLVSHLRDHLSTLLLSKAEVDLLVTGGYKVYSLLAGKFVAMQPEDRWRAIYLHEEEEGYLIIETKDAIEIDKADKILVRDTEWSRPPGHK